MSFASNRRRRRNAGITSVELALVAWALMAMVLAIFEVTRYACTLQAVTTLMNEVMRYAIVSNPGLVQQGCYDSETFSNLTAVSPPPLLLDPSQGQVCITFLNYQSGLGVTQVQVTVSYPFTATMALLSAMDSQVTQTTTYSY